MPLEWLFGRRMTPEEMLRKNQRALNKAMRDLDREKMHMEQQEKKLITDIKKMAKDGQMVCIYKKLISKYYSEFIIFDYLGICKNNGKRLSTNETISEKIHPYESEYTRS